MRSPRCARRAPGPSLPARGVQMQRGPRKSRAVSAARKDVRHGSPPDPLAGEVKAGPLNITRHYAKGAGRCAQRPRALRITQRYVSPAPSVRPRAPAGGFASCGYAALVVPTPRVARCALAVAALLARSAPRTPRARPQEKNQQQNRNTKPKAAAKEKIPRLVQARSLSQTRVWGFYL